MKLVKKQKVSASISDSLANLSVIGVFQVVEDAVTELMGELKIDGVTAKREYNAVWVFTRSRVKILKNIVWNAEEFITEAFISSITKATISIDVSLSNSAGERCVYARVELCPLDLVTGRIRRVETVGVSEGFEIIPPQSEITFAKFDNAEFFEADKVKIKYTNIDFARHTNNVEYVRFMLNTYTVSELESAPVKEMEVVFQNQSFEGDELSVCKGRCGNRDCFLIKKGDKPIVKSEIIF